MMRPGTFFQRRAGRDAAISVAALALAATALAGTGAQAGVALAPSVNPYSPAYHHSYRHGAVPTTSQLVRMRQWSRGHPARQAAASANDLNYGGGIDGIGVTIGHEQVYLVLYGSQWGTQGTDSNGYLTASGDPQGEAPYLQELMKGLGTGGELWSAVMTQYCDGVTAGSQSCPAGSNEHVAYPAGGALAGVWLDDSAASPSSATGNQLGQEAVNAAAHFGNTTAAANRNAQYVIMSPTGADPDGWLENGFCAWHDYNGDATLSGGPVASPYGDIAFTNLPYIPDAGSSCGQYFVSGPLDGVSIVAGHEYAETITDQNPAGGWTDSSGNETGDKCAWIIPGTSGGAFDLATATGTFAMQTTWANDGAGGAGSCEAKHAIVVTGGANTVTVTNPGSQSGQLGTATSLQVQAVDSAPGQVLTYRASSLPRGLSITSAGLISGTLTAAGSYSVKLTVTDGTGASGTATFKWTVTSPGGGIVNGGFEAGSFFGWVTSGPATSIVSSGPHSGSYAAEAGAATETYGDSSIAQTFAVPPGDGKLTFWYNVTCTDYVDLAWATATLSDNTTGSATTALDPTCPGSSGWTPVSVPVTAGDSYILRLTSHGDGIYGIHTLFDDVTLAAAGPDPIVNGGFETGDFTGWVTSGPATSIQSSGQHSGSYAAEAGSDSGSNGTSSIAQTFTAAPGDGAAAFWYDVTCQSFNSGDGAIATLTDNTTSTTSTVLGPDCPLSSSGWLQVSFPVTAGHSYTLVLASSDTSNDPYIPTSTLFDDVSLY